MTMKYHDLPLGKLSAKLILLLLLAHSSVGCSPRTQARLKILNATSAEMRVTSIEVNGSHKSTEKMVLPAMTAQNFANSGYVPNMLLAGGERLSLTVEQEGNSTNASCLVRQLSDGGVCLIQAKYEGTSELVCGYDCADVSSK